jgi:osmotically-inducible protein OsmY
MNGRHRVLRVVGIVLAAVLLIAAAPRRAAAGISDIELGSRVSAAVERCPSFGIFDAVAIGVMNGNVTITGWVTEPAKRDDIMRRAASIDGVRSLTSAIGVLPKTPADISLRERVARAIYGNALFWRDASSARPPIHVIVSHGHVTLAGTVTNDTERSVAFALCHVPGAVGVTNSLQVARN